MLAGGHIVLVTNHICLYCPAAEHHRPLAGTHCVYPRTDGQAELTCMVGYYSCEFTNFRKFLAESFRKFILIFPEISMSNCQSAVSKSSIAKWCYEISMFLTNNSQELCALTSCVKFRKNNLFLSRLPRLSANSNENYRHYTLQAFAYISGNIKFPSNFQPYWLHTEIGCLHRGWTPYQSPIPVITGPGIE